MHYTAQNTGMAKNDETKVSMIEIQRANRDPAVLAGKKLINFKLKFWYLTFRVVTSG